MAAAQLMYVFSVSVPVLCAADAASPLQVPVVETCGISSLFTIVYSNTVSTFRSLAELAELVTSPLQHKDTAPAGQKSEAPQSVWLMPTQAFSSGVKNTLLVSGKATVSVPGIAAYHYNTVSAGILYLFLWGIFLYLFRLRYFLFNARSAIDDYILLNTALSVGTRNPRFEPFGQMRVSSFSETAEETTHDH